MIENEILEPDRAQRGGLLEALAHAFLDNPMNVAIHGPRVGGRLRANRAGLRALVLDSGDETMMRVICHDGRVVGGFVAVRPGRFPIPNPSIWRQIGCFVHQGARAMDQWGFVGNSLRQLHPIGAHWYLAVIGVVPWLHGCGLGSQLLDHLLGCVSSAPAPIYLESDREESVRFYLSRGFLPRAEAKLLDVRCWCLGRGFHDE